MKKKLIIFLLTIILSNVKNQYLYAQLSQYDSLKLSLKKARHDTTRCRILSVMVEQENDEKIWAGYNDEIIRICEVNLKKISKNSELRPVFMNHYTNSLSNEGLRLQQNGMIDSAKIILFRAIKLKKKNADANGNLYDLPGMAAALNNIGLLYYSTGHIHEATQYYNDALKIYLDQNNKFGTAYCLSNLGLIYENTGDVPKALQVLRQSLKIREDIKDSMGMSTILNNIGGIYQNQGDYDNGLKYYLMALDVKNRVNDPKGAADVISNIGTIYYSLHDMDKAIEYLELALKKREENGDIPGVAHSLNNIGGLYQKGGDNEKAMDCYKRALSIREKTDDKMGTAITWLNIGTVYTSRKKYSDAISAQTKSLKLSQELGYPRNIRNAAAGLYESYRKMGNFKLALENYELYIRMRDSIDNEAIRKASVKSQLKYEYEKQAAADSVAHTKESEIKNAEIAKQSAEIKAKKNQQYALYGGLGLVIIFAGFMYNRFKITQKQKGIIELQKKEVEEQKLLVEEKQKEVLDSIYYAQRIQKAHLPSDKKIENTFNRIFNS